MNNVETLLGFLYADGNGGGGGGGGTTNYNALTNRPKINGHVLEGDKTQEDLGIIGQAPDITINATVDDTTGTPSVEVTKSGTDEAPTYEMAFTGLKGQQGQQGAPGAPGTPGAHGEDGFSPEITVEEITGGHRITITTKAGTESFDVMDGQGGGSDDDVFVATYGETTAQQINAFLDSADPKAPMAVKRGNDYYTVITTAKQAENKVIIRTFATLSGAFYIFTYTITDNVWANGNYGVQPLLVSGTNIKTVNGQSLLGSGNLDIGGGGSVDAYTKDETDALLAEKSSFDIATISTAGGGSEVHATLSQGTEQASLNYYKTMELPDALNLNVGSDSFRIPTTGYVDDAIAQMNPQNYVVCDNDVGGNVVKVGEITVGGTTYGLYQFYLKTGELPNATTAVYSFATLCADYTIASFIDATGVTDDGIFIGNGRTDNDNRLIVQQFSKNSKTVTIRTYKDFTGKTALLKILFYGTKNAA